MNSINFRHVCFIWALFLTFSNYLSAADLPQKIYSNKYDDLKNAWPQDQEFDEIEKYEEQAIKAKSVRKALSLAMYYREHNKPNLRALAVGWLKRIGHFSKRDVSEYLDLDEFFKTISVVNSSLFHNSTHEIVEAAARSPATRQLYLLLTTEMRDVDFFDRAAQFIATSTALEEVEIRVEKRSKPKKRFYKNLKIIAKAFKKNKSIKKLRFYKCHIGDKGRKIFFDALAQNPLLKVQEIELTSCDLTDADGRAVVDLLKKQQRISGVNIWENRMMSVAVTSEMDSIIDARNGRAKLSPPAMGSP